MTDDIVTRLRADAKNLEDRLAFFEARRHTEVADEIERLRRDRDNWREASERIAHDLERCDDEIERLRKEVEELTELWQKEVEDNRW